VDELDGSNFAKHALMLSEACLAAGVLLIEVLSCWGAGALLLACWSTVYCCAATMLCFALIDTIQALVCAVKPLLLLTF
jgi:hypothetical protein